MDFSQEKNIEKYVWSQFKNTKTISVTLSWSTSPVTSKVNTDTIEEYGYENKPKLQFLHQSWLLEAIFKV